MKKIVQASAQEILSRLRQEIWPDERSIIERPQRLEYVRKLVRPKGCVFCACSESKDREKHLVLYRGRQLMVILNKYPYNNGHLLVLPRKHKGDFLKMTDRELQGTQVLAKHCVRILKKHYSCTGFNMGLNLGATAGAGIPDHLHYHLIPRWSGDTNFFPLIAKTKLVVETTAQTYEKLAPDFLKLEKKVVF